MGRASVKQRREVKNAGGQRKLYNEELHDLYSLLSIIRIIKSQRVSWARHGVKMWLNSQVADSFGTGIQKLIPCVSILAMTMLRSSSPMYVFFVLNGTFFLIVFCQKLKACYFLSSPCVYVCVCIYTRARV
jgi:hypothetical protein